MPGTIMTYLEEYGEIGFEESPFNDVDALILCQLSYLKFDGLVPDIRSMRTYPSVHLRELPGSEYYELLYQDKRHVKMNRSFFEALCASKRFGGMGLNYYISVTEPEKETQFSAITFFPEGAKPFAAFRGTDETLVGWKEDFNMAFLTPVPGQTYSVNYINRLYPRVRGKLCVGGHSKGGNLAVFASSNCSKPMQRRIDKVYCMDGPGFRPDALDPEGYERIRKNLVKILPHASVIGMLMEYERNYSVVSSTAIGLAQHDPYTWRVEKGEFVKVKDIAAGQKFMNQTINEWVRSLDDEQMRTVVDALYGVVLASGATNLIELTTDWKKSLRGMLTALRGLDEQTAMLGRHLISSLITLIGQQSMEQIEARTEPLREKLQDFRR